MEEIKSIDGQAAFNEICDYILGKDWYVVDPLGAHQVNAIALEEMKKKWDEATFRRAKLKWNNLLDNLKWNV